MSSEQQSPFAAWPKELAQELNEGKISGAVGHELVSETQRVRIWSIRLKPGERIGFHRHVLDYFWTAVTDGRSLSHYSDGKVAETNYTAGDTKHFTFGSGKSMVHDLHNIGDSELAFTTVEFLDSANPPQRIPESVRRPG